jgi:hypothetical protein
MKSKKIRLGTWKKQFRVRGAAADLMQRAGTSSLFSTIFLFSTTTTAFAFRGCVMQCTEQFSINRHAAIERSFSLLHLAPPSRTHCVSSPILSARLPAMLIRPYLLLQWIGSARSDEESAMLW